MSLQPAMQYDRHTGQTITWYYADNVTKKPLTGATIAGKITNSAGTSQAIDGVLSVTDGPNGVFTWAYGALDTGTVGTYTIRFTATFANGPDSTFDMGWEVL